MQSGSETRPPVQRTRVAAYSLIVDSDSILLCRISPSLPRWAGQWALPGGGLEFGETPAGAAVREVEEESGYRVELDELLYVDSIFDPQAPPLPQFHGIRIVYRAHVIGGTLRDERDGTTDQSAWWPLDQLDKLPLLDLTRKALRAAAG